MRGTFGRNITGIRRHIITEEEKRLKEIKHLKYLKSELIKQARKDIKALQEEEKLLYEKKKVKRIMEKRKNEGRNTNNRTI